MYTIWQPWSDPSFTLVLNKWKCANLWDEKSRGGDEEKMGEEKMGEEKMNFFEN
jgi:hypothetical protein